MSQDQLQAENWTCPWQGCVGSVSRSGAENKGTWVCAHRWWRVIEGWTGESWKQGIWVEHSLDSTPRAGICRAIPEKTVFERHQGRTIGKILPWNWWAALWALQAAGQRRPHFRPGNKKDKHSARQIRKTIADGKHNRPSQEGDISLASGILDPGSALPGVFEQGFNITTQFQLGISQKGHLGVMGRQLSWRLVFLSPEAGGGRERSASLPTRLNWDKFDSLQKERRAKSQQEMPHLNSTPPFPLILNQPFLNKSIPKQWKSSNRSKNWYFSVITKVQVNLNKSGKDKVS